MSVKLGTVYFDLPVYEPSELRKRFPQALILVASTAFLTIKEQMISYGYEKEQVLYFQMAGIASENGEDAAYIWKYLSQFEQAYEWLEDEKSKIIFQNILNYRISKKEKYLIELAENYMDSEKSQYFDSDLIQVSNIVAFVDAGSYIGDTVKNLYYLAGRNDIKCYCFEADKQIYECLKEEQRKNNWMNIETYNYAVWNKKEELYLDIQSAQNGGSRISDSGKLMIQAESLDHILADREISFIKMDIEGAEWNALDGAASIIREQKPILAICVYHKPGDFFEIPQMIKKLNSEYCLYFRQYRYGQSETVCYALPKEKNHEFKSLPIHDVC